MTVFGKLLFKGKKLTFIVIKGDKLTRLMLIQDLANQFPAHRSAGAGDQNAFLLKVQLGFLLYSLCLGQVIFQLDRQKIKCLVF